MDSLISTKLCRQQIMQTTNKNLAKQGYTWPSLYSVLNYIVLYHIVLYIILYCIVLHFIVLNCIVLHCIIFYYNAYVVF